MENIRIGMDILVVSVGDADTDDDGIRDNTARSF